MNLIDKVKPEVIEILENDNYKDRLDDLRQARQLILDKYNLWPTIYRAITKGNLN